MTKDSIGTIIQIGSPVFVYDDGYLGTSEGNIVRSFIENCETQFKVKMKDGTDYCYQNAISTEKFKCPKCKSKITEIGRESSYVSDGYVAACLECDEDFYLFEVVNG